MEPVKANVGQKVRRRLWIVNRSILLSLVLSITLVVAIAQASFAKEYYKGKTLLRIPGNPTVVVDNMPGADSFIAGSCAYNKANRSAVLCR